MAIARRSHTDGNDGAVDILPRKADPRLVEWLRERDSYSNATWGRPSEARRVKEARAKLAVIVKTHGGTPLEAL